MLDLPSPPLVFGGHCIVTKNIWWCAHVRTSSACTYEQDAEAFPYVLIALMVVRISSACLWRGTCDESWSLHRSILTKDYSFSLCCSLPFDNKNASMPSWLHCT